MEEELKKEYHLYEEMISKGRAIKGTWININLPLLYNYLQDKVGDSIAEKFFITKYRKGQCKICKVETLFLSYNRGYRVYCSKKCSNSDPELCSSKLLVYKETCIEKYGVENASQSNIVKNNTINNNLKKYGVASPLQLESVKNRIKETCIEKYGVDNPSKANIVKEKRKETNLRNLGVENPFQSQEIKDKLKKTNIENYGVDHPLKSKEVIEKMKLKNLKKYGVDNYVKSKEHKENQLEKYKSGIIKTTINSDINFIDYLGGGFYKLKCDCNMPHEFKIDRYLYHARKRIKNNFCTICYPVSENRSLKEIELFNYIASVYNNTIIKCYRDSLEIDVYLPDLKIGFEFNGLYWHSEAFKDKNYHINKTNYFKEKGIHIIHIWEDDWNNNQEIIKSQINSWLNLNTNKIYARNCEVREVNDIKLTKEFLNNSHIQGYFRSTIKLGLYHKAELVSLMTFDQFEGRNKMSENEWNLSRFCNKLNTTVTGGASKLFNYFIENYNPKRVISFADLEWSKGDLYFKLGFEMKSINKPNYKYLIDNRRTNKQKYKKGNLVKLGFDENKSEAEIMLELGNYKIFDCGQLKFEKIFSL